MASGFLFNNATGVITWNGVQIGGFGSYGYPALTPPVAADYAWVNQGGAAATDQSYGIYMTSPAEVADNWHILKRTIADPASNWTFTMLANWPRFSNDNQSAGIILRKNSSGVFRMFGQGTSVNARIMLINDWTNATTYSGLTKAGPAVGTLTWLRARRSGADYYYDFSFDGTNWVQYHTTPVATVWDEVGWGMNCFGVVAGQADAMQILSAALS